MMRLIVLEGTAEEVGQVVQALPPMTMVRTSSVVKSEEETPSATTVSESASGDKKCVSEEFARRVLTRRPLSRAQTIMLDTLRDAYPQKVPIADLHAVTGCAPAQFAGVMGAFGRRTAATDGYDREARFFKWGKDEDEAHEIGLSESAYKAYRALRQENDD